MNVVNPVFFMEKLLLSGIEMCSTFASYYQSINQKNTN